MMKSLLCVVALIVCVTASGGCTNDNVNHVWQSSVSSSWSDMMIEKEFLAIQIESAVSSLVAGPSGKNSVGRGIVMAIGRGELLATAYTAITRIRQQGSTLPIELFIGDEVNNQTMSAFAHLGEVWVRDNIHGEEAENVVSLAMVGTRFSQFIVVDTHAMVSINIDELFSIMSETGLVFFPSLFKTSPSNPIHSLIGKECVPSFEQSSSIIVVDKVRAWKALQMAAYFGRPQFASLFDGNSNLLRIGALAVDIPFTMVSESAAAAGANYVVDQDRSYCAHSVVNMLNGRVVATTNLNDEVLMNGRRVVSISCYSGLSSKPIDDVFTQQIVHLQSQVPSILLASNPNACSGRITPQQIEDYLRSRPQDWIKMENFASGETKDFQFTQTEKLRQCGDYFRCGSDGWSQMDMYVKYFNISGRPGGGVQVDLRTKNSRNHGYGNDTYIQVVNRQGGLPHSDCDYPLGGSTETHVSFFNIQRGEWYVVAVAWGPPKAQTRNWDTILSIRNNGPFLYDEIQEEEQAAQAAP